jgi:hypothetical protein
MMADCIVDLLYEQLFQSQHVLFLIEMNDVSEVALWFVVLSKC